MEKVDYGNEIQSKIEELEGCVVRNEDGEMELHLIQDADLRAFAQHFVEFGRKIERTILGSKIKASDDAYERVAGVISISLMQFLDRNRPEGKMCLSNGECADIDRAFKEKDFQKIVRYCDKYLGKPEEESK